MPDHGNGRKHSAKRRQEGGICPAWKKQRLPKLVVTSQESSPMTDVNQPIADKGEAGNSCDRKKKKKPVKRCRPQGDTNNDMQADSGVAGISDPPAKVPQGLVFGNTAAGFVSDSSSKPSATIAVPQHAAEQGAAMVHKAAVLARWQNKLQEYQKKKANKAAGSKKSRTYKKKGTKLDEVRVAVMETIVKPTSPPGHSTQREKKRRMGGQEEEKKVLKKCKQQGASHQSYGLGHRNHVQAENGVPAISAPPAKVFVQQCSPVKEAAITPTQDEETGFCLNVSVPLDTHNKQSTMICLDMSVPRDTHVKEATICLDMSVPLNSHGRQFYTPSIDMEEEEEEEEEEPQTAETFQEPAESPTVLAAPVATPVATPSEAPEAQEVNCQPDYPASMKIRNGFHIGVSIVNFSDLPEYPRYRGKDIAIQEQRVAVEDDRTPELTAREGKVVARAITSGIPLVDYSSVTDEDHVGEGGCGNVRRVTIEGMDGAKVVKTMKCESTHALRAQEMLLYEAEMSLLGKQAGVMQCEAIVMHKGRIYGIVYPYYEGGDFYQLLKQLENNRHDTWKGVRKDIAAGLDSLVNMVSGVAKLHEKNIAHMDLKPGNMLANGTLIDMGMAQQMNEEGFEMTAPFGTPAYWAPEVGAVDVNKRPAVVTKLADMYSVGLILSEFCMVLNNISKKNSRYAKRLTAFVEGLDRITMPCLEKNPLYRVSAEQLAQQLSSHSAYFRKHVAKGRH